MKYINKQEVQSLIASTQGQFFRVSFIKKNGDYRTIVGRLGVRKGLKANGKGKAKTHGNMTVWDTGKQDYRTVSLDSVYQVTVAGQTFDVI